jgi:DNA polymerase-3 subunit gamma/tau
MAVQALYRKWRPRTFDEVVGQEHVVRTLRNALVSGRIHHAYLFAGPRGTGKTTLARLLAKAVNCLAPEGQRPCNECTICQAVNEGRLLDLIEIDAASNTGVDDVRELRERVGFRPNEGRYKVYVIDEVHMLSNAAFNALLKTLEEPPPHAIFVLATTESHKIPATVISRCQRFDFRRVPVSEIVARLEWMTKQEHIQADQQALTLIARQATGSMRDAESLLDQLASYDDSGITVSEVHAALGTGANETVIQITNALAEGNVAQGLGSINTAVDEGADPRQFARQMVEHLRTLLLLRLESDVLPPHVSDDQLPQLKTQAAAFSRRALAQAVRLFNQAADEAKGGWQPQLPLEMAFIEAMLLPGSEASSSPPPSSRRSTSSSAPPKPAPVRSASPSPSRTHAKAVREPAPTYKAPPTGGASLTPETLRGRWAEFLDALRPRNLSLEALVRSCEPVAVEGDVVVLGFAHKFHRSKVEEEQKKQIVEDVLSTLFGRQYRVRCILSDRSQPPPSAPQHSTPETIGSTIVSSAEQLIAEDPLVRAAVEDLGAQIVSS